MTSSLASLLPLFDRLRAADANFALATVIATEGPTYSKTGELMIIAPDGEYAGLLSGGCLEGDLAQHAAEVLRSGVPQQLRYDGRSPDDALFGLGSGCEGAINILLQRTGPAENWEPLTQLAAGWRRGTATDYALVVRSADPQLRVGSVIFGGHAHRADAGVQFLQLHQRAPLRLLLLGAGPDATPVANLAVTLGWQVEVRDHRPSYVRSEKFPGAKALCLRPEEWDPTADGGYDAAVVMSHHLLTDLAWLRGLATSTTPYIGLLGPASRRDRLLRELGTAAASLRARLHAPVGLDIGADSPQTIAVAIVAQIQSLQARSRRTV
jgi:xanthine/CO dehydrogenase XdhC/CoxF family maturation factor